MKNGLYGGEVCVVIIGPLFGMVMSDDRRARGVYVLRGERLFSSRRRPRRRHFLR